MMRGSRYDPDDAEGQKRREPQDRPPHRRPLRSGQQEPEFLEPVADRAEYRFGAVLVEQAWGKHITLSRVRVQPFLHRIGVRRKVARGIEHAVLHPEAARFFQLARGHGQGQPAATVQHRDLVQVKAGRLIQNRSFPARRGNSLAYG
jgi:hypothetical protein